jgi:hypothetical protein
MSSSLGQITDIGEITTGPKPQMGPLRAPIVINMQGVTGSGQLEITRDAAEKLVKELSEYLQKHR